MDRNQSVSNHLIKFVDFAKPEDVNTSYSGNAKYVALIPLKVWNSVRRDDPRESKIRVDGKSTRESTREKGLVKIYFGDRRYEHYYDRIGGYPDKNHMDNERRQNYRARHSKITDSTGYPYYKIPYTPAWFSWNMLW